jgi:hypothetical protein
LNNNVNAGKTDEYTCALYDWPFVTNTVPGCAVIMNEGRHETSLWLSTHAAADPRTTMTLELVERDVAICPQ